MKLLIPFAAACCHAVQLQQTALADEEMNKTILGFFFEGRDFGDLWVGLTDDQRTEIKNSVFDMALQDAGFNPADFAPDRVFKRAALKVGSTEKEKSAELAKSVGRAQEKEMDMTVKEMKDMNKDLEMTTD